MSIRGNRKRTEKTPVKVGKMKERDFLTGVAASFRLFRDTGDHPLPSCHHSAESLFIESAEHLVCST